MVGIEPATYCIVGSYADKRGNRLASYMIYIDVFFPKTKFSFHNYDNSVFFI